jgi:5,6-dimethylbenzimidazole synthase
LSGYQKNLIGLVGGNLSTHKDKYMSNFSYTESEKAAIYKVISERRDMRHFNNQAVDADVFKRILSAAQMAPNVGLMQPWRFIRITDRQVRESIFHLVDDERQLTAVALGEQKKDFLKLKVEGILDCAELVVAVLPDKREHYVFGRRTLPEMDLASLSCAIQNMWLASRAEGIGMGWVSLFDPNRLMTLLNMPEGSLPIAILCIGHVDAFYEKPMLVLEKWAKEKPLEEMVYENFWQEK